MQALTIDSSHVMSLLSYSKLLLEMQADAAGSKQYIHRALTAAETQLDERPRDPSRVAALSSVLRAYGVHCLAVEQDVPHAYQLLLRATQTAPDDTTSWVKLAIIHHHYRQDWAAAATAYERALFLDHVNHEALVGLATLLVSTKGRLDHIDMGPIKTASLRRVGGAKNGQKKKKGGGTDLAARGIRPEVVARINGLYERAVASRPKCPRTALEFSRFLDRVCRPPKLGQAETLLERAVELAAQGCPPMVQIGLTPAPTGEHRDGLDSKGRPASHASQAGGGAGGGGGPASVGRSTGQTSSALHVEGLLALAQFVDFRRGDPERASTLYGQLEALAPDLPEVLFARAQWEEGVRGGHLPEAEKLYRRALERDPLHHPSILGLANLVADTVNAPPSASTFAAPSDGALDLDSYGTTMDRSLDRSVIAQRIDADERRDEAAGLYQRAMKLAPNDAATLRSFGLFTHVVLGEHMGAAALFKKSLHFDPNHIQTNTAYGLLLLYVEGGN